MIGPNHKDGCDGQQWTYSGGGYDRVRLCACGAEDHDPEPMTPGLRGATIELLLARAIAQRPIEGARGMAISTLRRFLACGYSRKARTNLTPSGRGLTEEEMEFIATEEFIAEEDSG